MGVLGQVGDFKDSAVEMHVIVLNIRIHVCMCSTFYTADTRHNPLTEPTNRIQTVPMQPAT